MTGRPGIKGQESHHLPQPTRLSSVTANMFNGPDKFLSVPTNIEFPDSNSMAGMEPNPYLLYAGICSLEILYAFQNWIYPPRLKFFDCLK